MVASIVIGAAIFGYAGWTLARFIKRSGKEGKCATCELRKSCSKPCDNFQGFTNKETAARH